MVFVTAMTVGCGSSPEPQPYEPVQIPIKPGQVWTYRTRPGEESSRITVCLVEANEEGRNIVHVAVDGLKLKNPSAPSGLSDRIGHMAFNESAFRASVRTLESTSQSVPAFNAGYEEWQKANGGGWDVSAAEALDAMESVLAGKR